jgi:hypothetical protein
MPGRSRTTSRSALPTHPRAGRTGERRDRRTGRRTAARTAVAALLTAVALAGCGGSGDGSSDMGGSAEDAASAPQAGRPDAAQGNSGGGSGGGGAGEDTQSRGGSAAQQTPGSGSRGGEVVAGVAQAAAKRVRTAQVTVEVEDLGTSAAVVRQIAVDLGGLVGSETTGFGQEAVQPQVPGASTPSYVRPSAVAGEAVIVLRVPEPKLDEALLRVSKVGKELTRTSSSDDVTARLADIDSRIATQQRSLTRVRALLDQASGLNDIVTLEAELSRREADLESLQAQQRALSDQAALSTLTAILRLPDAKPSTSAPADEDEAGFLKGFEAGWDALVTSTTVVLTIVGALLPVAIVVAVVGVPLWLLLRRFRPEPRPRPRPQPRPVPTGGLRPPPVPVGVGATQPQPAAPAATPAAPGTPPGDQNP